MSYAAPEKSIIHFDMDTYFVSCERLNDSSLKNKPILIGGTGNRGVVSSCSYETRKFGIHSGMPMAKAKVLCPEAICIKGSASTYMKYSKMVTDIIQEAVPVLEKTSIDEFYADVSGMDKFFGIYKYAKELRQRVIKETGLPLSFGLSQNKVVSKVATGEAKPNNQMKIDLGYEKEFLAPLAIRKIPMIGAVTAESLRNLGVYQVKQLQQMPLQMVSSVLGKNGKTIWEYANGIDKRPIVPFSERKSISLERTFNTDTIDNRFLKDTITAMGDHLAYQLRREDKLTGCVAVKLRYTDFTTETKQLRIPYTSADHKIKPVLQELFDKIFNRRILVRMIGVKFSNLVGGHYQINLFDDDSKTLDLYKAMDQMKERFGPKAVVRASTMAVKTIRDHRNPFKEAPVLYAYRKQ